jgi:tol-pal system protein YbgF
MIMGHPIQRFIYIAIITLTAVFFLAGCGSSRVVVEDDDWADRWDDEQVTEEVDPLAQMQADNAELRQELARMAQENRSLNARIAELEKRLLEERDRARELEEARRPEPAPAEITLAEFDREYTRAVNLFMNRQYQDARNLFTKLLNSGVNHPLVPNCQYWIGESLYGLREYRQAIDEFQKVFNYSAQVKHDDAQIMIANSYFMLGDRNRARQEYQRLIERYPNSDYVALARQRLGEM